MDEEWIMFLNGVSVGVLLAAIAQWVAHVHCERIMARRRLEAAIELQQARDALKKMGGPPPPGSS